MRTRNRQDRKWLTMYRAIKLRIYPTDEQESYLARCFGNTRWLWNHMLNATTTEYKETGKGLSKVAMDKLLPGLKKGRC